MRIYHPETQQSAEVDEDAFRLVYQVRGWVDASTVVPDDAPEAIAAHATSLTVSDALDEVGDDPVLAAAALETERAGRNRKTLVSALEQIVQQGDTSNPEAAQADTSEEPTS